MADTTPTTLETPKPAPRPRRRLPPHMVWGPEDEDDADAGPQSEGEHPAEHPPPQAAMSVGEILLEMGRDPAWQRYFQKLQAEADPLRGALHGRNLRRLSRLAALPIGMIEKFAQGAKLPPGSRELLTRAVYRKPSRPARLRSWLESGQLKADDAARALGVATSDIEALAAGTVRVRDTGWQRLERLALG